MSLQGQLRDLSVANLIQYNCMEARTARIMLKEAGQKQEAILYIEKGKLVHAELGDIQGEEVVFKTLGWMEGSFSLDTDFSTPTHSIQRPYNAVLLDGMQRIDENATKRSEQAVDIDLNLEEAMDTSPRDDKPLEARIESLSAIEGVTGTVLVAKDGVVIAHKIEGNPDKEGAVAVFVGHAASQVGEALSVNPLKWAIVTISQETVLVFEQPNYFIGLFLDERASPALVAANVQDLLS